MTRSSTMSTQISPRAFESGRRGNSFACARTHHNTDLPTVSVSCFSVILLSINISHLSNALRCLLDVGLTTFQLRCAGDAQSTSHLSVVHESPVGTINLSQSHKAHARCIFSLLTRHTSQGSRNERRPSRRSCQYCTLLLSLQYSTYTTVGRDGLNSFCSEVTTLHMVYRMTSAHEDSSVRTRSGSPVMINFPQNSNQPHAAAPIALYTKQDKTRLLSQGGTGGNYGVHHHDTE
jgi:hypothetical protein